MITRGRGRDGGQSVLQSGRVLGGWSRAGAGKSWQKFGKACGSRDEAEPDKEHRAVLFALQ